MASIVLLGGIERGTVWVEERAIADEVAVKRFTCGHLLVLELLLLLAFEATRGDRARRRVLPVLLV